MSGRNDNRFLEDVSIMLAMYCDENGLTLDEGHDLAERVAEAAYGSAEDRADYLPPAAVRATPGDTT